MRVRCGGRVEGNIVPVVLEEVCGDLKEKVEADETSLLCIVVVVISDQGGGDVRLKQQKVTHKKKRCSVRRLKFPMSRETCRDGE